MPGLTPDGRRVIVFKAAVQSVDDSVSLPPVSAGMKVVMMVGDIRLAEESIGVAGDVYVLDAGVATPNNFAQHFAKFTPALVKKFFVCVQVTHTL